MFYFLVFSLLAMTPSLSWACASCGCTLSPNWQDSAESKFKADLRWDYVNQTQLRSGTSTISPGAASQLINNGSPQEVEVGTKNNYFTASGEYHIDESWRVVLQVPYIVRDHTTLGTASDGSTGGAGGGQYSSSTSNLGDVRLLGRFQGFSPEHDLGIIFGAKLPTGSFNLTGSSTDPTAPGPVPIDRGLQPGSGTTDVIFGVYYTKAMNKNWDYFAEGLYQAALNSRDDYRPGDGMNANIGFRYFGYETVLTPQIQLNGRYVQHDTGANSDTISTGGTLLYLSPGITVPIASGLEAYGFFQIPIYQNVLGVQLTPTSTASIGIRYVF